VRSQEMVRLMKTDYKPSQYGAPEVFSELLVHCRSLPSHLLPNYVALQQSLGMLAIQEGCDLQGPLDWTPCNAIRSAVTPVKEPDCSIPSDDEDVDYEDSGHLPKNSYFALDIDWWDRQGDRDKDLTLPLDQEVALDGCIAHIVDVIKDDI